MTMSTDAITMEANDNDGGPHAASGAVSKAANDIQAEDRPQAVDVNAEGVRPSLGTVIESLERNDSLPTQTRRDLVSAFRKVASWIGPDGLTRPADPGAIAEHLRKMSPAMAGLKKGSMANLRSRIRRGLKIAGISVHGGKRTNPLTPEWLATAEALGYGPRWWALSAFAHFASKRN